jgi:hypothetical protein
MFAMGGRVFEREEEEEEGRSWLGGGRWWVCVKGRRVEEDEERYWPDPSIMNWEERRKEKKEGLRTKYPGLVSAARLAYLVAPNNTRKHFHFGSPSTPAPPRFTVPSNYLPMYLYTHTHQQR